MARIPVQYVNAQITAGSQVKTGTADVTGSIRQTFRLTQAQYEALSVISATGTKEGYQYAQGQITALPSFSSAVANGISMDILMEKYSSSSFFITPMTLTFPSTGGTGTVIVDTPDNGWSVYSSDPDILITKTGPASLTVNCPAGSTEKVFAPLVVRWYDTTAGGWQYRECVITRSQASVGQVTISGRVTNIAAGTGIPSAEVVISAISHTAGKIDVAVVQTDSSGNYSYSWPTDEITWSNLTVISIFAEKAGYNSVSVDANVGTVSFADAVANGITLNGAISQIEVSVTPSAYTFPASGGSKVFAVTAPDNSWDWSINGITNPSYFPFPGMTVVADKTNNTLTITMPRNTSGSTRYATGRIYWGGTDTTFDIYQNE